jgi:hypothetical protein
MTGGRLQRVPGRVALLLVASVMIASQLGGCVRRTIAITSDPPGATVTVNDVQVGRTPCEFDFMFHGVYDVLFEKPGYEPLRKPMRASAPLSEYPPVDLGALAWPGGVHTKHRWHVTMLPSAESLITSDEQRAAFEADLLRRANDAKQSAAPLAK